MSTGTWRVKPSEIVRTVKSLQATGLRVRHVDLRPDGTIRINTDGNATETDIAVNETPEQLRELL